MHCGTKCRVGPGTGKCRYLPRDPDPNPNLRNNADPDPNLREQSYPNPGLHRGKKLDPKLLYVQEVLTHFIVRYYTYILGQVFLDREYSGTLK